MTEPRFPLLLEPEALAGELQAPALRIVDLSRPQVYAQYRVPGAVHLDYGQIVRNQRPVGGLLPEAAAFAELMAGIGIDADTWVIAYDDEGGGNASRLLYTLQAFGHHRGSLLNGGIHAWANEGFALATELPRVPAAHFVPRFDETRVADADYILSRLGQSEFALLDARSAPEYAGAKALAARGGRIPGAVHLEWTDGMDRSRNLRMRPLEELRALVEARGLQPKQEVVVYCQTHHRSAFSYIMLQALGFPRVRGYPGSWSDWGNRQDTPVETG